MNKKGFVKKNEDEIILYASKTFTLAKEKEAKKYYLFFKKNKNIKYLSYTI